MSHPFLRIGKNIVKRYREFHKTSQQVENPEDLALLIGTINVEENQCDIWNAIFIQDRSVGGIEASIGSISVQLPAGLHILGFLQVSRLAESVPNESTLEESTVFQFLHTLPPVPYRFLSVCEKESLLNDEIESVFCFLYNEKGDRLVHNYFNPVCWATSEELHSKTFTAIVSVQMYLEIILDQESLRKIELESVILEKFQEMEATIDRGDLFFETEKNPILISVQDCDMIVSSSSLINGESSCLQLFQVVNDKMDEVKKIKELRFPQDRICFELLQKITGSDKAAAEANCVPVIYCQKGEFERIAIPLKLKCVGIVSQDAKVKEVGIILKHSILRQLKSAEICFQRNSHPAEKFFASPEPHVFYPPELNHFLTIYYPNGSPDGELEDYRRSLHMSLNLPLNKPLLRRSNAHTFPDQHGAYLRNVHERVGNSAVNGSVSLVEGNYEYHHYMQDNFNDNGWGCAYRSFQTVWSWFLLQGYTKTPVPSHRQIQEALVEVGDKERSFVGSKLWVGSLELSYCLSQMMDISSRILTASSGEEMDTKARELANHFETQGTPVMIGGGVLAHTILGVDFNEETGDVKFLVLDPHYTGEENIRTIIDKGWCGWKPVSFWDQNSFYNMLLPQRPHVI